MAKPVWGAIRFAIVIVLSVFYLVEWRRSRLREDLSDSERRQGLADLRAKLEADNLKANSVLRALVQEVHSLSGRISKAQATAPLGEIAIRGGRP